MSYQKLIDEHARIDTALARLTNILDRPERDAEAATAALSHLAEELHDHLAHEDAMLYHELIIANKPAYAHAVEQFTQQFDALRRDWSAYLGGWTTAAIAADWPIFRTATRLMVERLAERVAAENDLLYCAALQFGAITLRDQQISAAA
ncbi:hemerythrin domain-containing protein [Sphingomonas sp. 28-63-12]|uniref:hemerythrin domain-containing protein n=1 Tax=Sphingomonas sp. 28-63-12 TaxID=1970434 RepID=UPI000BCB0C63|nr:MAG: hypothetical protein B7Y47_06275 [Sphingomonas sp. 28-63-12]